MQIGDVAGRGASRIDHDHAQLRVRGLGRRDALDTAPDGTTRGWSRPARSGPRISRSVVVARHGVLAERALVSGDRGRHAQPRVGVDVRAADEALHQLVGDVVILGQQLPGDVERDRVRSVLRDRCRAKPPRDDVERLVPARAPAARSRDAASRPSRSSVSPSAAPFEHSRPRLAGCCGSPRRRLARPPQRVDDAAPQPTPQYGHVVRTLVAASRRQARSQTANGGGPSAATRASALAGKSISTRPSTTHAVASACSLHPAPTASPVFRSMTQLCSGQVTRVPCTMPCDSGPPRVRAAIAQREHLHRRPCETPRSSTLPTSAPRARRARDVARGADVDPAHDGRISRRLPVAGCSVASGANSCRVLAVRAFGPRIDPANLLRFQEARVQRARPAASSTTCALHVRQTRRARSTARCARDKRASSRYSCMNAPQYSSTSSSVATLHRKSVTRTLMPPLPPTCSS